jgi:hypothetical protein
MRLGNPDVRIAPDRCSVLGQHEVEGRIVADELRLTEHAARTREMWNSDAPNWVELGREAWASRSPCWDCVLIRAEAIFLVEWVQCGW